MDIEAQQEVVIRAKRPNLMAMVDGEIERLSTPLRFKILPKALSVLVPPKEVDDSAVVGVPETSMRCNNWGAFTGVQCQRARLRTKQ